MTKREQELDLHEDVRLQKWGQGNLQGYSKQVTETLKTEFI